MPTRREPALGLDPRDDDGLRKALKDQNIEPCILFRAHRNAPLTTAQKYMNALFSGPRAGVERCFATMKQKYRLARVRYFSLARNNAHFQIVAFAINLRRVLVLEKQRRNPRPKCA